MTRIRIGIVGYGNLGRAAQAAIAQNSDMELVGVFSRRELDANEVGAPTFPLADAETHRDDIDVMILCGGSAQDLPKQTPLLAQWFNTVDSFDTHARIPEHFASVDTVASKAGNVSLISIGWDPGLFSLNRLLGEVVLPEGKTYTFWGKGLSQGHSDAIRRVSGVKAGVQYTIPDEDAIDSVRRGEFPELAATSAHRRACFIVPEEGADLEAIERDITTMENYFVGYDTSVSFIDEDEMAADHVTMPHGGLVLRSGLTGNGEHQVIEYSLTLESNPGFTASVLVAYARAAHRMSEMGMSGAHTIYDVAPGWLSRKSGAELRAELL